LFKNQNVGKLVKKKCFALPEGSATPHATVNLTFLSEFVVLIKKS